MARRPRVELPSVRACNALWKLHWAKRRSHHPAHIEPTLTPAQLLRAAANCSRQELMSPEGIGLTTVDESSAG